MVKRNPAHICMVWVGVKKEKMNLAAITNREQANQLQAVQNKNLYIFEKSLFCRPSPRLIEGIKKLSVILN